MISRIILDKSDDNGHSWLVPDFKDNAFNFPPFSMALARGLSN
jgi:hypothetical protein